jgi:hypothetical protein
MHVHGWRAGAAFQVLSSSRKGALITAGAVCIVLLAIAALHIRQPLTWDEIEFFRATRWIAEGEVPFRDYWEHHLPLQWFLFAPVAALFGGGAGVDGVVAMRWAQVPLWIAIFVCAISIGRRAGIGTWGRWAAVVLLVASPWFAQTAVQYRLDVPANLACIAAIALIVCERASPRHWAAFGALMSAAVLSNMRLAPLVISTAAVMLFWHRDEPRWSWNGRALWMMAGVVPVAALFVAYLYGTGAIDGFLEGVIHYNVTTDRLLPAEAGTFLQRVAGPFVQRDVAGIAFVLAAAGGAAAAFPGFKRPDVPQIVLIVAAASLISVALMGVHYDYHFQNAWILMVPLAAVGLDRVRRWRLVVVLIAVTGMVISVAPLLSGAAGEGLRYQDLVMLEADRVTAPDEKVWDGCGYALRREPAYRYWFLPAGVRLLAQRGMIEPYDLEQISADPPAAIVYNYRTELWMQTFPRLAAYVFHHYVPLYQNLWVPGMSASVGVEPVLITWTVPATGSYEVWTSELLVKHPWLARPREYGLLAGADLEIPLDRLSHLATDALRWRLDGKFLPPGTRTLELRRGSQLELHSTVREPAGVMVIPQGVTKLSVMPDRAFAF